MRLTAGNVSPQSATTAARSLAMRYGADPASADWRHLGRLAGFTNQKPARRQSNGWPPWVRILFSAAGVAPSMFPAAATPARSGTPLNTLRAARSFSVVL